MDTSPRPRTQAGSGVFTRPRPGPSKMPVPSGRDQPAPTASRSARLRAAFAAWQEAQRTLPEAPAKRPRARRRGLRWFLVRLGLAALLGWLALHLMPHQPGAARQPQPPVPTTPASTPGRAPSAPAASATANQQDSAAQAAATFLAASFTWQATDTDNAYAERWLALVAPDARRDLLLAAPRLTLDQGADTAAQSPTPALDAVPGQLGQVQARWTIQVLPAGGEQVAWQPRQIEATLTLIQTTTGWQVTALTWTSSPGGHP